MTARRVAAAQREAVQQTVAPQLTWSDLGCPKDSGVYRAGEGQRSVEVHVKRIHIMAAEDDPHALFTVIVYRPPLGPPEYMLGHRVA